ncbi:histidine kinase [Nostoc sp.]
MSGRGRGAGSRGSEGEELITNAQYFGFAQYKCPMPHAPCPMPHAQCPMPIT